MRINMNIQWCRKLENALALAMALFVLIIHLVIINQVDRPIYDAGHYVAEANALRFIAGEDIDVSYFNFAVEEGYESLKEYKEVAYVQHGPLSKLFIYAGIKMFGDNPFGWRIFPILFGASAIVIFYLICQELTSRKWLPLIATFIFAFENMCFVMSGIAMLDAIGFTFMLGSFLAYLRGKYISAGVLLAFAGLAKTMMALGGGVILAHWFLTRRGSNWNGVKFAVVAPLAYLILLPILDYVALRELVYPWDRIYDWFTNTGGGASWDTRAAVYLRSWNAIHPWEWVVVPKSHVIWVKPNYEITVSWTLWAMIIPSMCYALYEVFKRRRNSFCVFALSWFVFLYLPWFVIDLFIGKVSYAFHFYPVVGSACLAAGYLSWKLLYLASRVNDQKWRWIARTPVLLWMAGHFVIFWVMSPVL